MKDLQKVGRMMSFIVFLILRLLLPGLPDLKLPAL